MDTQPELNPTIQVADIQRQGGVLVWNVKKHGRDLPSHMRVLFPQAGAPKNIRVRYKRSPEEVYYELGYSVLMRTN